MGVTMWVVFSSFVSRFLVITPLVILRYKIRLFILSGLVRQGYLVNVRIRW